MQGPNKASSVSGNSIRVWAVVMIHVMDHLSDACNFPGAKSRRGRSGVSPYHVSCFTISGGHVQGVTFFEYSAAYNEGLLSGYRRGRVITTYHTYRYRKAGSMSQNYCS